MKPDLEVFVIKITMSSCLSPCCRVLLLHPSNSSPAKCSPSPPSKQQLSLPTFTLMPASLAVPTETPPPEVAGMGAHEEMPPMLATAHCRKELPPYGGQSWWGVGEAGGSSGKKLTAAITLGTCLLLLPGPQKVSLAEEALASFHQFPRFLLSLANDYAQHPYSIQEPFQVLGRPQRETEQKSLLGWSAYSHSNPETPNSAANIQPQIKMEAKSSLPV